MIDIKKKINKFKWKLFWLTLISYCIREIIYRDTYSIGCACKENLKNID